MQIIDGPGLTDSPVPVNIYVKALRLEGYLIESVEERDGVLAWLLSPEGGVGHTVVTGPGAEPYWVGAPVTTRVKIVPADAEIPQGSRSTGLLHWMLTRRGLTRSEATGLVDRAPTVKSAKYSLYVAALTEAESWSPSVVAPDTLPYVGEANRKPVQGVPYTVTLVEDWPAYVKLGEELEQARRNGEVIGLDVETDEDENYESGLVGAGFAFLSDGGGNRCYYLPLNGPLGEAAAISLLVTHFLEKQAPKFDAHGGKFDMQVLAKAVSPGRPIRALRWLAASLHGDGLLAAYCLGRVDAQTGRPEPKGLKHLTSHYYRVEALSYAEMLGLSGASRSSEAPIADIGPYCCADAYWGIKVLAAVLLDLERTPKLVALYERVELPTVAVLAEMELLGLPVDMLRLKHRKQEYTARVEVLRRYLEQLAIEAGWLPGTKVKSCKLHSRKKAEYALCSECDERGRVVHILPFNPNARLQVESILQGAFGLPRFASTDGGDASNDEPALLRLRDWTTSGDAKDWITIFLEWRHSNKTLSTYLVGIWDRMRYDSWQPGGPYIHSIFNQDIVESGRLSSKDINQQNFPLGQRDLVSIVGAS